MVKKIKRILIMAGGTGGHVFPGLVVADYFRSQQVEVHWLGTAHGLEARLVPEANIPLHVVSIYGLRGKGLRSWFVAPFNIFTAVMQSKRIINQLQPDIIFGMGGFVSGPGGIASWLSRCSLVIHEQNAIPGLTNKILARFAYQILVGFPHVFSSHRYVRYIGNPVRPEIENLAAPEKRFASIRTANMPLRLLVLGGSLGAKAINELLPVVVASLSNDQSLLVWHQTGDKHFNETLQAYESLGLPIQTEQIKILPFIRDMKTAYAFADIVLCRAGALTIAELCAVGVGSILIPYPYAVDDHQTANAEFMVKKGASLCLQQRDLTTESLLETIKYFIVRPEKHNAMAEAAYQLRQPKVAEKIFNLMHVDRVER